MVQIGILLLIVMMPLGIAAGGADHSFANRERMRASVIILMFHRMMLACPLASRDVDHIEGG